MKQAKIVTSVYSVDLFGICSLLYELGGLIVMHDASGCNSTYATHDEPRWYDMDSMIYISGLTEFDAVMGNDEGFIEDVLEIARERHPRFIAVFGSPVAMIMGTDFRGIARIIERRSGIPCFGFETSGMRTYVSCAAQAMTALVRRLLAEPEAFGIRAPAGTPSSPAFSPASVPEAAAGQPYQVRDGAAAGGGPADRPLRINLLGVTPLDFSVMGNVAALQAWCREMGFQVWTTWCMGDFLEDLARAPEADVDLVCSAMALPAAKELQVRYGIPYVIGLPYGTGAGKALARAIRRAAGARNGGLSGERDECFSPDIFGTSEGGEACLSGSPKILLIGEPVACGSLRVSLEAAGAGVVRLVDPLEDLGVPLRPGDVRTDAEEDLRRLIGEADLVIADPLYRRLLPEADQGKLIRLPHEAYSGRMYRAEIPVLVGEAWDRWLEKKLPPAFRRA